MIVKFKADTPMYMEFEIDTNSVPLEIKYSGWQLSLANLQELHAATTAALECAESAQFSHDYDAAHKITKELKND